MLVLQIKVYAQSLKLILPIAHTDIVNSVCFSPDGKRVLTGSVDMTAKVWDVSSGALLANLGGHSQSQFPLYFDNGKKILTQIDNSHLKIWNATTGTYELTVRGRYVSPNCTKTADAFSDSTIWIWDIPYKEKKLTIKADRSVNYLRFSPDNKKLALMADSSLIVCDVNTGSIISFIEPRDYIRQFEFSPDDTSILIFTSQGKIVLWDSYTGKQTRQFNTGGRTVVKASFSETGKYISTTYWEDSTMSLFNSQDGSLYSYVPKVYQYGLLTFSPNDDKLITTNYDKTLSVWDLQSKKWLYNLKGHSGEVTVAAFSADGSKIVTGSEDWSAKIWNGTNGSLLHSLESQANSIFAAKYLGDGNKILTASNVASLWDVHGGQRFDIREKSYIRSISSSPDSKFIATASGNNITRIWNADSLTQKTVLQGHKEPVNDIDFSPTDHLIATGSKDSTIKIWDINSGRMLHDLVPLKDTTLTVTSSGMDHFSGVNMVRFSPDGSKLLSLDVAANLWDVKSGLLIKHLYGHASQTWDASYSRDGSMIATTSVDNTAKIWDGLNGNLLKTLNLHEGWVRHAAFSPDNSKLVTSSDDSTAIIWDLRSGNLINHLQGHTASVLYVTFSPDGKKILTTSEDHTGKLWDAENGKLIATLKGHSLAVREGSFSPGGGQVLTISNDNTVKVWNTINGQLIYTFLPVGEKGELTLLPSGYYKSTPDAARHLHYVTPDLKVVTFEQLDVKYNRPDLVLNALGYPDTMLIKSYRNAYEKRINKLKIDTTSFHSGTGLPEADFQNRDIINSETNNRNITLTIRGTDTTFLLDRFNIWINEVPVFGSKGFDLVKRATHRFDTTVHLVLSDGRNSIETSVTNRSGTESYRMPLVINNNSSGEKPERLYFIGVGIDKFKDATHNLSYSVKDIRDLCQEIKENYGDNLIVDTLFNTDVTATNINKLKTKLLSTSVNDKVILSYSGHGLLSTDFDYFLSTWNVNFKKPEEGGLPFDALESLLDSIPARKKLMLIDACHSGEVDKEEMKKYKTLEKDLKVTGTKGVEVINMDSTKLGMRNSFELMQELFVNVGRNTGTMIISAASGTQMAQEGAGWSNGVFTYSILEYSKTHRHVGISGLREYVNKRVPELTKGLQQPTSRSEIRDDWQLW